MKKKGFRFYWEEDHRKEGPEINIDLPGFSRDEISVSIDKGFINISAEKKLSKKESGRGFYREESFQQSFKRSMSLPDGISPEDMEVKVEDGAVKIKKKKKKLVN